MELKNKKKISIHTSSGEIAATAYYRIYQYLDCSGHKLIRHKMVPEWMYARWMPISKKPLPIKVMAMLILYFRKLYALSYDLITHPDIIVLSRGLLPRYTPKSFMWLLGRTVKSGTKLIWDFDDNIIENGELRQPNFDKVSRLASKIIVASKENILMLPAEMRANAIVLPTTDKDLYRHFNEDLLNKRLNTLYKSVRLIWLGSASGLEYIAEIVPFLDSFAAKENRNVSLTVVCNRPLEVDTSFIQIRNIKWSREAAVEELRKAHIGLMPLKDNEITRGKGGFKLIQYLSIGLPVIGSPVGINNEIIIPDVGFKALTDAESDWVDALGAISKSDDIYWGYAQNAFRHWNECYSYERNLQFWEAFIN